MEYPNLEEVKNADIEQICRWHRFLPSPRRGDVGQIESDIMEEIRSRLKTLGGYTVKISKKIGWKAPK